MKCLSALVALVLIVACDADSTRIDGEWELASGRLDGVSILPSPSAPGDMGGGDVIRPVILMIDGRELAGEGPCNSYGRPIEITERQGLSEFGVAFGEVFSELQGCSEIQNRVEQTYLSGLLRTHRGHRTGDRLTLEGEGVVLVYKLIDPTR